MNDKIDDIVVPILRNIQEDVSTMKADVSVLKESVRRIDARLGTMDYHQAAFHAGMKWQSDELDVLRGRIEALEDKHRPDK